MGAMTTTLNPYLNFRGTARDAMTYYQSVLGGELTVSSFDDFGALFTRDEVSTKYLPDGASEMSWSASSGVSSCAGLPSMVSR